MNDIEADLLIANAKIKQLEQQLAESQRREKAAVEAMDEIYERIRPGGKEGGYPYGGTTCIGTDVYNIVANWRGPQQAGKGS
jgi:hypothetical protein